MHDSLRALQDRLKDEVAPERTEDAAALAVAIYRRLPNVELDDLDIERASKRVERALEAFERGTAEDPTIFVEPTGDTTLVHVHLTDGPFVMSTVTEELNRLGLDPVDLAHPVVGVERDDAGALQSITTARQADHRETYLALDLQTELEESAQKELAEHLHDVLADAIAVVSDFTALKVRVREIAEQVEAHAGQRYDAEEVAEVADFLHWLLDDHFVFLGYRAYDMSDEKVTVIPDSGLGILHDASTSEFAEPVALADLSESDRQQATEGELLNVARTGRKSTVHRQVRMICVAVQKIDDAGDLVGEHRILGLLAQKAFVEPSSTIPVLRRKLRAVLEAEDVVDHSQDERALRTLFDAFPKQELFESDAEELRDSLVALAHNGGGREVGVLVRPERSGHSVSALVTLPRARFSGELRMRIQRMLREAVGAESVDYQLSMTERDQPLLHFTLRLPSAAQVPQLDVQDLQRQIVAMTRTFEDRLADALADEEGIAEPQQTAEEWCRVLPGTYIDTTPVATAVIDIEELTQLDGDDDVRMRLVRPPGLAQGEGSDSLDRLFRFRLYKAGSNVELSGFVPLLESLGLTVVEEQPYELIDAPVAEEVHLHDYGVRCDIADIDVATDGPRMAAAALAMWHQKAGVDSLNRLVVLADMTIDEVTVLRAYRRYQRQIGTTFTEATTNEAFLEHPRVARSLLGYFDIRFDPNHEGDRGTDAKAGHDAVLDLLDGVERLDQDRILRSFLGLVTATLRTNRWQHHPWLSFKLDSSDVPGVPKPVPYREIFVYSIEMEGVHLRGGPVARGGLRWSDRMDDFRTEVLGLMKAQVSKNAVIVPTGSKGGFVLKQRPADPTELRAEVERQYRVFIRGMLDLTDNLVDGEVVGPPVVVRADGDDPYLVVAADRGTATFSDIANSISREYDFWLDDAFASGGSQGYDHKEMGITARGAWVAVQRHFRELGIDVQTESVTVVGVGDMSGDVFGNGLLRSKAVKLIAAFDHRDIFIDPSPDPEASYNERKRLFELSRSSWQDYDPDLISTGGGVWSRTAKTVPLSPEAREVLNIDAEELSPPELINAMLKAPADLLWFGGIGTYVKAAAESHSDVGDRANDAIRVDADELGARVVGEGGNLAMTQRARIAYGRRGGRSNTDAIDNVAGVNTSDREVNLKILLRLAVQNDRLDPDDRDDLLASLTEQVGEDVLRDSYLQTWSISQELHSAPGGMGGYEMLMSRLEERDRLDREVEVLPSTAEMDSRREQEAGMTRAELSVMLAYAKIDITDQLLQSDVIDQPAFDTVRQDYFPEPVATRFADLTDQHRLRRELVATQVANDVCNRMGITWVTRTAVDLGVEVPSAVAAYWIAREVIDADACWRQIEELDGRADPVLQFELKSTIDWLVDAYTRSYVRLGRTDDVAAAVSDDRDAFVELSEQAGVTTLPGRSRAIKQAAERWIDLGIDETVAEGIAALPALTLVPGIALTARRSGRTVAECGRVYEIIAERLPLEQLNSQLRAFEAHGRWERGQHRGLVDDLRRLHHMIARQAIAQGNPDDAPEAVVDDFLADQAESAERAVRLTKQVQSQADADLNALAMAVRSLSEIAV